MLADGSERAQVLAAETMKSVKDIVGFVRRRERPAALVPAAIACHMTRRRAGRRG